MFDDASFIIFGGMMAIVIWALIIQYHNTWEGDWTVLVTLIGWIALIKGIFLLAFPKLLNIFKPMFESEKCMNILPVFVLVLGIVFGYLGVFL
jgi:Kef-type K+ transport system membrane component KefB